MRNPDGQKCGGCNAYTADPGSQVQGVCRARPPTPLVLGVQQAPGAMLLKGGAGGGAMMPVIQGVFPPMRADSWCREWQPIAKAIDEAEAA
jgi:hypothetical protein